MFCGNNPPLLPQKKEYQTHAPVRKPSTAEFGERGGVPVTTLPLEHSGSTDRKHKLTGARPRARWAQGW